jgi:hypothetical protein
MALPLCRDEHFLPSLIFFNGKNKMQSRFGVFQRTHSHRGVIRLVFESRDFV